MIAKTVYEHNQADKILKMVMARHGFVMHQEAYTIKAISNQLLC